MSKLDYTEATDNQLKVIIENPYANKDQKEAAKAETVKRKEPPRYY